MTKQSKELKEAFGKDKSNNFHNKRYKIFNNLSFFMYFYRYSNIKLYVPKAYLNFWYHSSNMVFYIKVGSRFKLNINRKINLEYIIL